MTTLSGMAVDFSALNEALAGRYELIREIGRGGMAVVYLATDGKHSRQVAIKVLAPELAEVLGSERFLREIQIAAQLQHPHVLALYDSGADGGYLYYVMPFVEGESLRDRMSRQGALPLNEALELTAEVADALQYAHGKGIAHRDIKPENILLLEGHAVVADFGIAKALSTLAGPQLTRTGFPLGTPGYMSPEQAAGSGRLNESTDVFSLACVCYELIVGEVPGFWPSDAAQQAGMFVRAPPEHRARLDLIPGAVEHALVRAMAMDPADRFAGPREFADALYGTSDKKRSYRAAEVERIVRKAAELEVANDTDPPMSFGGVKRIAAEAGIPVEHVERAARELDRPPAPLTKPRLFGLATGVQLESVVEGEVPDDEIDYLLDEVRREIGSTGRIDRSIGRSLTWTSTHPMKGGVPETSVHIQLRKGRTTIRLMEDQTQAYVVAASGAVVAGMLALPVSAVGVEPTIIAAAFAVLGAGTVKLASVLRKRRHKRLAGLLDRLTMIAEDSLRPDGGHPAR